MKRLHKMFVILSTTATFMVGIQLPLTSATASKAPTKVLLNAPYISQNAVKAWMGCESASLLEGLHYQGVQKKTGLVKFMKALPRSKIITLTMASLALHTG